MGVAFFGIFGELSLARTNVPVYYKCNRKIDDYLFENFMERMRKMKKKNGINKVICSAIVLLVIDICLFIIKICFKTENVPNKFSGIELLFDIMLLLFGAIGFLLLFSVWGVALITAFKKGLHNIRYSDDKLWEEIDVYKHRWIENGEYYKKMIRVINCFYQKNGKVDKLVKEKSVDRLFLRLDFLNAQMEFEDDLKSAIQSLVISVVSSVIYGLITKNEFSQALIVIIEIISVIAFFLIVIVFYSWRGKFGSYDYLINEYEKKLLLKKIAKLNKVLRVALKNEETLKAQQIVIDALIEKCKKAKKEDQDGIEKDIHIVESLQLDVKHKNKLYVRKVQVGKDKIKLYYRKERENSCCNFDLLINDEYKKMYKILEKYEWL